MSLKDENKFDFYVGEKIDGLRDTGDWSDKKIARFLRAKATELHPLRKTKKITIPKEFVDEFIKKEKEKGCGKEFEKRDLLTKRNRDGSKKYSNPRKAICGEIKLGNSFIDLCSECEKGTVEVQER